jgi:hypothetical protein
VSARQRRPPLLLLQRLSRLASSKSQPLLASPALQLPVR